jgi:hypothetical protein
MHHFIQIISAPPSTVSWPQVALAIGSIVSPLVVLVGVIWTNLNTGRLIETSTTNAQRQIDAAADVAEEARSASSAIAQKQIDAAAKVAEIARIQAAEVAQKQIDAAAKNATKQAQASVVSTGRLRWIDSIREDVADLLAAHRTYHFAQQASFNDPDDSGLKEKVGGLQERMEVLLYRVELRLTAGKAKHDALLALMKSVPSSGGDLPDYGLYAKVIAAGRDLFYSEWKRLRQEVGGEAAGPLPAGAALPDTTDPEVS